MNTQEARYLFAAALNDSLASLSAMSLSAVSLSGMRSRASATHINSTPSSLERSYWRMKDSTAVCRSAFARTRATSSVARASTRSRSAGGKAAWATSSSIARVSSRQ